MAGATHREAISGVHNTGGVGRLDLRGPFQPLHGQQGDGKLGAGGSLQVRHGLATNRGRPSADGVRQVILKKLRQIVLKITIPNLAGGFCQSNGS